MIMGFLLLPYPNGNLFLQTLMVVFFVLFFVFPKEKGKFNLEMRKGTIRRLLECVVYLELYHFFGKFNHIRFYLNVE